jgi:hypothetical protein
MTYNPRDATQRTALASELGLAAYTANAGKDQTQADQMNTPQAGITVRRNVASSREVMSAIAGADFVALAVGGRDYLIALVSPGEVDLGSDVVRASLTAAFPAGATRDRLIALADKTPASRAEQLFGIGTTISATDVAMALRP